MRVFGCHKRVCTESWLLKKNPLQYWGIKPVPVVWWSYTVPTELHPHPHFLYVYLSCVSPIPSLTATLCIYRILQMDGQHPHCHHCYIITSNRIAKVERCSWVWCMFASACFAVHNVQELKISRVVSRCHHCPQLHPESYGCGLSVQSFRWDEKLWSHMTEACTH